MFATAARPMQIGQGWTAFLVAAKMNAGGAGRQSQKDIAAARRRGDADQLARIAHVIILSFLG
jgi:hypothetical protein